jgi:hypothetical protein
MPEQHDIMDKVIACALINPATLLPQHRLIFEMDFEALGSGPALHRLLWLAVEMDSAMTASSLLQLGSLTPMTSLFLCTLACLK